MHGDLGLGIHRGVRTIPSSLFPQLQVPSALPSPQMAPMLLLLLPSLAGLFALAEGQAFHMGKCPNPPVQENFDVHKVR